MTVSNYTSYDPNDKVSAIVGPGSLPNEKVPKCKICAANGFPHEPIIFKKIVIEKWQPFDYLSPWQQHKHRLLGGKQD